MRGIRWEVHEACIGNVRNYVTFWSENLKGIAYLKDLDVDLSYQNDRGIF
jgi:hypothetical protein